MNDLTRDSERLLTVEFSRQGQYVRILEAVLTMIGVTLVALGHILNLRCV